MNLLPTTPGSESGFRTGEKKEGIYLRKSLEDIAHILKDIPYPKLLPKELIEYHYYLIDAGHSIMCVLQCYLEEAKKSNEFDLYEVPVPVKYVLAQEYQFLDTPNGKYVLINGEYDPKLGLIVDEKYYEY